MKTKQNSPYSEDMLISDVERVFGINACYFADKYKIDREQIEIAIVSKKSFSKHIKELDLNPEDYKKDLHDKNILFILIVMVKKTRDGEAGMLVQFLDKIAMHCILLRLEMWYGEYPELFKSVTTH